VALNSNDVLVGAGRGGDHMTSIRRLLGLLPGVPLGIPRAQNPGYVPDPASLVDPLIGTSGGVNCFPGAAMPFGMVQWSPDTPSRPFGGGYEYDDSSITGFSLTHLSGPGCPVFGDVPLLPTVGAIDEEPGAAPVGFSHESEQARPGFYGVTLTSGVAARLTVSTRAGIGEFTFPRHQQANLLITLSGGATESSAASARIVGATEIAGSVTSGGFCGGPNTYTVYFSIVFDRPFASCGTWRGGAVHRGARQIRVRQAAASAGTYVSFRTASGRTVRVKVGLSYVSEANARANIAAEIPDWDFAKTQRQAHARWNETLGRMEIGGGSRREQRIFYTALYHCMLHPNVFSDANGQYLGFDDRVHTLSAGHSHYANFSGWDVYRCEIPLIALLAPRETSDMMQSMVDDHAQSGLLPKWSVANAESFIMVGDPAAPIIAAAYAFGARDFDTRAALAAMLRQAGQPTNVRPGLDYHDGLGYLPIDGTYGCCNFYGPVSTQLEYDVADFATASYAAALGEAAESFASRAQNWANVFDPGSGFLRPKLASGQFLPGFDPTGRIGFVEGNAYQYTPMLPFNVRALVNAMGGAGAFVRYLDAFFTELNAERSAPYAWLGNEPCLGIPWEYDYAGAPYKTQEVVRRVQRQLYTDGPAGEPGNDDLGAMSSWFVWSALGCYPVTPGTADLALGSPLFPRMRVHLGNGRQISIDAPQAAPDAPYVHGMLVDGQPWSRAYLPPSVLSQGAHLAYTLGTDPDPDWAAGPDAAPASYGVGEPPALGFVRPDCRIVVPVGGRTTVTLGARAIADDEQTVTWAATAPRGVTLHPSSGILRTRPSDDGTVPLLVTAGHEPGAYPVTFQLTTAAGTTLPKVVLEVVVVQPEQ